MKRFIALLALIGLSYALEARQAPVTQAADAPGIQQPFNPPLYREEALRTRVRQHTPFNPPTSVEELHQGRSSYRQPLH